MTQPDIHPRAPQTALLGAARLILILLVLAVVFIILNGCAPQKPPLTHLLAEPLENAVSASIEIDAGDGNLSIDALTGSEPLLAGGELEYGERQDPPVRSLVTFLDRAELTLQAGEGPQPFLDLPWAACNGATHWKIHLHPSVTYEITANSNGGNIDLDFSGLAVASVSTETGGGNVAVILPDTSKDLAVTAKSGGGNVTVDLGEKLAGRSTIEAGTGAGDVTVYLPANAAARLHLLSGKPILDARFEKVDENTYQSPGFESAADQVELTLSSGIGEVNVNSK